MDDFCNIMRSEQSQATYMKQDKGLNETKSKGFW